jgi:hypothetical protein
MALRSLSRFKVILKIWLLIDLECMAVNDAGGSKGSESTMVDQVVGNISCQTKATTQELAVYAKELGG